MSEMISSVGLSQMRVSVRRIHLYKEAQSIETRISDEAGEEWRKGRSWSISRCGQEGIVSSQ